MESADLLGFAGAIFTTGAYFPQVLKSLRTQRVKDFSWAMLGLLFCGLIFWLIYGLAIGNQPLIITNVVSAILVLILILIKIRNG